MRLTRRPIAALPIALALAVASHAARAQVVRGRVVGADTVQGLAGAVVQLVDSAGHDVARSVSDERGAFSLHAPAAGRYAIRTLRIGYAPGSFGPYAVAADGRSDLRLALRDLPLALGAIRVEGRNECRVRSASGPAALALWEQARAALVGTLASRGERRMMVTVVTYQRITEGRSDRTTRLTLARQSGESVRPFGSSRAPDEYAAQGYRVSDPTGETYLGPDADVLLAESFGSSHCFRVDPESDRNRDEVGLAFEPLPRDGAPVDVAGTLWIGRRDAALRRLEYHYVGTTYPRGVEPIGHVEFALLPNGLWVIPRWTIDVPRVEVSEVRGLVPQRDVRIIDRWRSGGMLMDARDGDTVLWTAPAGTVRGTVAEEKGARPVADAAVVLEGTDYGAVTDTAGHFEIDDVLPGSYVASVRSPAAEQLGLRPTGGVELAVREGAATTAALRAPAASEALDRACNAPIAAQQRSMLTGVVRDTAGAPVAGASVTARWVDTYSTLGNALSAQTRTTTAAADGAGAFRLCGVVRERPVVVHVAADAHVSDSVIVRLDPGELVGRLELRVRPAPATVAGIDGRVVDDAGHPVAGTRVELLGVGAAQTDSAGRYAIGNLAPGAYLLRVRRVGFAQIVRVVTVSSPPTPVHVEFQLSHAQQLATIEVRETSAAAIEAARRRAAAAGALITAEEIARRKPTQTEQLLRGMAGVVVHAGGIVQIDRGRSSFVDMLPGGEAAACQGAQVFVDGAAMAPGFDVNTVPPQSIASIEVYRGAATTPETLRTDHTNCGTIAIWTR